jgi:hypothetical protein
MLIGTTSYLDFGLAIAFLVVGHEKLRMGQLLIALGQWQFFE